jgi:hypothetical protein
MLVALRQCFTEIAHNEACEDRDSKDEILIPHVIRLVHF